MVTGDTKVVERGKCDSMYVVTTGVGLVDEDVRSGTRSSSGPATRCSSPGTIGDHGVAIMLARGDLDIEADVRSDTQPLWSLAAALHRPPAAAGCTACATPPAAASPRC